MLCTVVMLRGLRAGIPAELHHDDESCAILRIHAGGLGSVINQILLSMVVLPYSRFYIDDTDSKYRCSAHSSWDDTFQGSVRAMGEESTARNCTAIPIWDGVFKMNDMFTRKELEGSAGHAALFHKKLTALQQLWALSEPLKLLTARHVDFVNSLPRPLTAVHVRSGQFEVLTYILEPASFDLDGYVMPCNAHNMQHPAAHLVDSASDCASPWVVIRCLCFLPY